MNKDICPHDKKICYSNGRCTQFNEEIKKSLAYLKKHPEKRNQKGKYYVYADHLNNCVVVCERDLFFKEIRETME